MDSRSAFNSWIVPREWAGETAYLLGGGPSLQHFDPSRLRGRRVIAINKAFKLAPWADVLYFCDLPFFQNHQKEIETTFVGRYIVTQSKCFHPRVLKLRNNGASGLELNPVALKHGGNSGYQAINLAFHFGVSRIVLLGFDLHTQGVRTHWHEGYKHLEAPALSHIMKTRMLPYFPHLVEPLKAHGVEVINACEDSALKCWPRMSIDQALAL